MALEPHAHYAPPSAPLLVNQVLALPLQAQLGLLRTVAPKILAQLGPDQRDGFERDLHAELSRALRGEQSYDVRAGQSGDAEELYRTPRTAAADTRERRGVEVPVEFRNPDRAHDVGAAAPGAFVPSAAGDELAGTPRWPKGYKPSDERLRDEACEALSRLPDVDVSEVEVWVTEGELTLTGAVPQRSMKYAIELSCARVVGVSEIHNRLRVPHPSPSASSAQRHSARATGTYARFMRDVLRHLAVGIEQAEQIVLAVIAALEQRIVPHEAMDLEAQLPSLLQDLLQVYGEPASFRARDIDREKFIAAIADRLEVSPAQAEEWTRCVFRALNERVSAGEVRQVKNMLPPDIRALWP